MKIRIETRDDLQENELVLYCRELSEDVIELQRQLSSLTQTAGTLTASRGDMDYFLKYSEILFMETDGTSVAVHTAKQIYYTKQKLYELENSIPYYFMRVSKSTIINTREIRSIRKNITGASEIEFSTAGQFAYVSRSYYKSLMEKLNHKVL